MRSTSMGATMSKHFSFDDVSARNWIIFAFFALLLGFTEVAAATQTHNQVHFSSNDDSLLAGGGGGGPYVAPRIPTDAEPAPVTTPRSESSIAFNATEYWDAVAALNLSALHNTAEGDAQQGFARGLSLLADGDAETAEKAFIDGSEQQSD